MALNCICWNTRFQLMIPLKSHTPQAACKAFYQWIRVFGPPERVYCDLGREFKKAFHEMAAQNDFQLDPGSLEAPTQRSITERSGRTFKEILSKTVMQTGCTSWEEWHDIVDVVCATVNRLTNKSGFSPMQRMIGFNPRLPGSILSGGEGDHSAGSLYVTGDTQVQRAMEIKKQAAIAYHEADCSQAIRHAIHAGPKKLYDFTAGQTVYFWRKGMNRQKKDSPAYWHGPAKVVLTDLPTTVWVVHNGYLVKACPEHLRLTTDDEKFILTDFITDILETKKLLDEKAIRGYIILEDKPPLEDLVHHEPVEGPEPPVPRIDLPEKQHTKTSSSRTALRRTRLPRTRWTPVARDKGSEAKNRGCLIDLPQSTNHHWHLQKNFSENGKPSRTDLLQREDYIREKLNVIEELFDLIIQTLKNLETILRKDFVPSTWKSCSRSS